MPMYDFECEQCKKVFESLEPVDTKEIFCSCRFIAKRIITTPPTWKFADTHKGMWVGDSKSVIKKFTKTKGK